MKVRTSARESIAALNDRPDVRYAYPVLYDLAGLHRIMLTDRIVVCLASADVAIATVNQRYRTETVGPLTGNQWVVRLVEPKENYPVDVAEAIAADPAVAWAEPDFIQERDLSAVSNDTFFGNQWHLHSTGQSIGGKTPTVDNDMDAPEAWNITVGSPDVIIAIIDTGVQTDHPDLAANIHPGGYDFYDDDADPNPSDAADNHGTPCAGVAAAVGNNNLGVAGMAYGCRILPIKIVKGNIFVSDSVIADAIRYAAQYADVISCSWGGGLPSTTIRTAIRDARQDGAGGKGSLVLFASGNSGGFRGFQLSGFSAATYTFNWKYSKNSSVSEGEDTCWLDSVTFPDGVTENFDSVTPPALPSGWSGSWTSMYATSVHPAHSGNQFVKANSISHSQTTYLSHTRTLSSAGSLTYYMRVNCEDNSASYWQDYGAIEISGNTYLLTAGTVAYPSAWDSSVCVGACNSGATKSEYSQYGPQLDFVAPSSGNSAQLRIETTDRTGTAGYNTSSGTAGDYCKAGDNTGFGGTSSSTPLAAGIAALVRSVMPDLSPAQIRNIMRETASKIDPGGASYAGRQTGRNVFYGWGRANAYAAVQNAQASRDIMTMANDLKITEVTDKPAAIAFIEIYNKSTTEAYSLDNLALTDNEAGNDTAEGSCRFPEGYTLPPRGLASLTPDCRSMDLSFPRWKSWVPRLPAWKVLIM
ncbi:MAG: S8 family serine peptidase [Lentisphaerae bacterium]|nr:S8 family serine peptidase [Lentisphaerota bacterium]